MHQGGAKGGRGNCPLSFGFFACQLRAQSCSLMIIEPQPHDNSATTLFFSKEKNVSKESESPLPFR